MDNNDLYSFTSHSLYDSPSFSALGPKTSRKSSTPGTSYGGSINGKSSYGLSIGSSLSKKRSSYGISFGNSSYGSSNSLRPPTSNRAAGFTRGGNPTYGPKTILEKTIPKGGSMTLMEQVKNIEKQISGLIEESYKLLKTNEPQLALEKTKEAMAKEKQSSKIREQMKASETQFEKISLVNSDILYCLSLNLAACYHGCKMYGEALSTYGNIIKNKIFGQAGRLRVNCGNILMEEDKIGQAVKMYKMALVRDIKDRNKVTKEIYLNSGKAYHIYLISRFAILRNIGIGYLKMGQFQDAIVAFTNIIEGGPDSQSEYNLFLCYHTLGDVEKVHEMNSIMSGALIIEILKKMHSSFQRLVRTTQIGNESTSDDNKIKKNQSSSQESPTPQLTMIDGLTTLSREKTRRVEGYIVNCSKILAPLLSNVTSSNPQTNGYDTVIHLLHGGSFEYLICHLEISKTVHYLKTREFSKAIETLKSFEKRDITMISSAATNLSFLYQLEGDFENANKYADMALEANGYNAKALTNKGICLVKKKELAAAKQLFQDAVSIDSNGIEGIYNLALVLKEMESFPESLALFQKLHSILQSNPHVIFHIADIYDIMGNTNEALEWFSVLTSVVPTDPTLLSKMGDVFIKDSDRSQAFHYYSESNRFFPFSIPVVTWLGAYYLECNMYEQAIIYFERAFMLQPNEIRWVLTMASCYRKSGNYGMAYGKTTLSLNVELLKHASIKFPKSKDCLTLLVSIGQDMGLLSEIEEWNLKLNAIAINEPSLTNENPTLIDKSQVSSSKKTGKVKEKIKEMDVWDESIDDLLPE